MLNYSRMRAVEKFRSHSAWGNQPTNISPVKGGLCLDETQAKQHADVNTVRHAGLFAETGTDVYCPRGQEYLRH